jgi:hypothetical protein
MTKPEPGDKVRVTYEGVYTRYGTVQHPARRFLSFEIPSGSTVEVLESADDPSKDPVGTVRAMGGEEHGDLGPVAQKIHDNNIQYCWAWLRWDGYQFLSSDSMVGRKIIGYVPGTPAEPRGEGRDR